MSMDKKITMKMMMGRGSQAHWGRLSFSNHPFLAHRPYLSIDGRTEPPTKIPPHPPLGNREIFENLTISGSCPYPQLSWACYALYPINQGVISEIHPQNMSVPFPRGVLKVSKFAFPKPRRSCLLYPLTHTCYFSSPLVLHIHCWI